MIDQLPKGLAGSRVYPGRRLIQKQDLGVVEDGTSEGQALSPACGEVCYHGIFLPGKSAHLHHLTEALVYFPLRNAIDPRIEGEILPYRQIRIEGEALGHVADFIPDPLRLRSHISTPYQGPTGSRRKDAAEHPDGGRLACPIGAQEAKDLPGRDDKGDRIHRDKIPEPFGKPFSEDRFHPIS